MRIVFLSVLVLSLIFAPIPTVSDSRANTVDPAIGVGAAGLLISEPVGWGILAGLALYTACPGATPEEKARYIVQFLQSLRNQKLSKEAEMKESTEIFMAQEEAMRQLRAESRSELYCKSAPVSPEVLRFTGKASLLYSRFGIFKQIEQQKPLEPYLRSLVNRSSFVASYIKLLNEFGPIAQQDLKIKLDSEKQKENFEICLEDFGFRLDSLLHYFSMVIGLAAFTVGLVSLATGILLFFLQAADPSSEARMSKMKVATGYATLHWIAFYTLNKTTLPLSNRLHECLETGNPLAYKRIPELDQHIGLSRLVSFISTGSITMGSLYLSYKMYQQPKAQR